MSKEIRQKLAPLLWEITRFSIDALANIASALGRRVTVRLEDAA